MTHIIAITDGHELSIADALACPETRTAIDVFESLERALYLPPAILSKGSLDALRRRVESIAVRLEQRHPEASVEFAEALVMEAFALYLTRLAWRADQ